MLKRMGGPGKQEAMDETASDSRRRFVMIAVLVAIALVGLWLRLLRVGDPIGGFHGFNEAFYTLLGEKYANAPLMAWLTDPIDLNNPPLYPALLGLLFRIFEPSVVLARLVSALSGVGTALVTFWLGKTVFNERVGLIAAAVLAVMPGAVLVEHNAQTDALLVLLVMAAVACYAKAAKSGRRGWAIASGAILGLALVTKLPAVVVLPGLAIMETWKAHGLSWLKERRVWQVVVAFLAVGLPWYVYQWTVNAEGYFGTQRGILGNMQMPNARFWSVIFANEVWWMLSPLACVALIASIVVMARRRKTGDILVLALLAVQLVFYVFLHFHTYYLLAAAPLAALAIGRGADRLRLRIPRTADVGVGVLVAVMTLCALVTLAGNKIGRWSPDDLREGIVSSPESTRIYVNRSVYANHAAVLLYYFADYELEALSPVEIVPEASSVPTDVHAYLVSPSLFTADRDKIPFDRPGIERPHAVIVFGISISQVPQNEHFMANGRWDVHFVGAPWFGLVSDPRPGAMGLYDLERWR